MPSSDIVSAVNSVASGRISALGQAIGIDVANTGTRVFQFCSSEHPEVFRGRHVDIVVLCAVYVAAKAASSSTTFKALVRALQSLRGDLAADGVDRVVRDVRLDDGSRGDVIAFYNSIFVPLVKGFLRREATAPVPPTPALTSADSPMRRPARDAASISRVVRGPLVLGGSRRRSIRERMQRRHAALIMRATKK